MKLLTSVVFTSKSETQQSRALIGCFSYLPRGTGYNNRYGSSTSGLSDKAASRSVHLV